MNNPITVYIGKKGHDYVAGFEAPNTRFVLRLPTSDAGVREFVNRYTGLLRKRGGVFVSGDYREFDSFYGIKNTSHDEASAVLSEEWLKERGLYPTAQNSEDGPEVDPLSGGFRNVRHGTGLDKIEVRD